MLQQQEVESSSSVFYEKNSPPYILNSSETEKSSEQSHKEDKLSKTMHLLSQEVSLGICNKSFSKFLYLHKYIKS